MKEEDNLYFILDLPYSPIPDGECIRSAIGRKQDEWSRQLNNPAKKDSARKWLSQIGEMRQALQDPDERKRIADQARLIKEKKLREIRNILSTNYDGSSIPEEGVDYLLREYGRYRISTKDLRDVFRKAKSANQSRRNFPNTTESYWDLIILPDKFMMGNIEAQLQQVGKETLYQFLELPKNAELGKLNDRLDRKEKALRESAISDFNEAGKKLCGFARDVFSSFDERVKYDNYLDIKKWEKFNKAIDYNAAVNGQNTVSMVFLGRLLQSRPQGTYYKLAAKAAYLYCRYSGYRFSDTCITCAKCGCLSTGTFFCVGCGNELFEKVKEGTGSPNGIEEEKDSAKNEENPTKNETGMDTPFNNDDANDDSFSKELAGGLTVGCIIFGIVIFFVIVCSLVSCSTSKSRHYVPADNHNPVKHYKKPKAYRYR